jgi:hypothetical protein
MDSKLKMVKGKDGKMVPAFAADGKGKMAGGGMMKAKMMSSGGMKKGGKDIDKKGMSLKADIALDKKQMMKKARG